jgi:hypothetical protein
MRGVIRLGILLSATFLHQLLINPNQTPQFTLVQHSISFSGACAPACSAFTVTSTGSNNLLWIGEGTYTPVGAVISSVACSPSSCGTWVVPAGCNAFLSASGGTSCAYVLSSSSGATSITVTLATSASSGAELDFREYHTTGTGFVLDGTPQTATSGGCSPCQAPNVTITGTNDVVISLASPDSSFTAPTGTPLFAHQDIGTNGGIYADNFPTTVGTGGLFTQSSSLSAAMATIAFSDNN